MKVLGIIPARFASSRFPGKPLADIHGKSMIQRVVEQVNKATRISKVVVATDDARIFDHVNTFGTAVMTSTNHPSGTDRCLEAYEHLGEHYDAIVNIQGDEPFIHPEQIDDLIQVLSQPNVEIATQASAFKGWEKAKNPNRVKVVLGSDGKALYFSRSPMPYLRAEAAREDHVFLKHIGLYGYKAEVLAAITKLSPSSLEIAESLEQLRWLESGYTIHVGITTFESPAVDTPDDLQKLLDTRS